MSDDGLVVQDAQIVEVGTEGSGSAEPLESSETVQIGQWYWIKSDKDKWFACVVHVGSNYVRLEAPSGRYDRIHFDDFYKECTYEPDPDGVINGKLAKYKAEVDRLLGRVAQITAGLSIGPSAMLGGACETQALALRADRDMGEYSKALVKAKKETLPELFKQIEKANKQMAVWMTAKILPLKAKAGGLNQLMEAIEDRVFSVELYAGLTENVERVKDGQPAPIGTKIHLMQRRCYMDEECLAQYETGGMEFGNIADFDAWLCRPANLDRVLPFPRCMVAFQVRRRDKERERGDTIADFIRILNQLRDDKRTFLYIRNGDLLYRMNTAIEFGSKMFPDMDRNRLGSSKLWAQMSCSNVRRLITDDEHTGMLEDHAREQAEYEVRRAAYDAALRSPEALQKAKDKGYKQPDSSCVDVPWPGSGPWSDIDGWVPYDRGSVYYDDITAKIAKDIQAHNRIALILQGLLDRSVVLHPHPPWQIWSEEGFHAALELVFDDSRALSAGAAPDFEAYRAGLNASLRAGCITVGQQILWEEQEAEKENDRRSRFWRDSGHSRLSRFRPDGNPGPGSLAHVADCSPKMARCSYAWLRERLRSDRVQGPLRATFTCDQSQVLNVSAYKPGDFRIFFDDPRTCADYLQWAPLLLEAEEFHAGNRTVLPAAERKRRPLSSWEGQLRYRRQRARKQFIGKAVRQSMDVTMRNGTVYTKGTLWRVVGFERIGATLHGIADDGSYLKGEGRRSIRGVDLDDLVLDPTIPDDKAL